jgi:hypothetical protein
VPIGKAQDLPGVQQLERAVTNPSALQGLSAAVRWQARVRDISKLKPKFFFGYRWPGAQLHRRADVVRKALISVSFLQPVFVGQCAGFPDDGVPERAGLLLIPSAAMA